ncbi:MAG TPA: hypothetical protein VFU55_11260 [Terracidiphilus sp.]|nr:hypothetical protein [Terracidiphilus sp.]
MLEHLLRDVALNVHDRLTACSTLRKVGEASAPEPEWRVRGSGGRGLSGGGDSNLGGATSRHYALTLSMSALNALNHPNLARPINILGSPLFGQTIALSGGPYSAQVGNPVANRLISVSLALSF